MRARPSLPTPRVLLALLLVLLLRLAAMAAPGQQLGEINLPIQGSGVSVGADCQGNIYYTNAGDARLHKINRRGKLLASIPTTARGGKGGAQPVFIDEIAWDETRHIFWGGEHASNPIRIWRINPKTGECTLGFVSATPLNGVFVDGVAFDPGSNLDSPADDQILVSADVSRTIEFHRPNGQLIRILTPKNEQGRELGAISGVLVGVGDLLYLGQNGRAEIVQVKKSDGTFIRKFASPGGVRDEGLECDPISFGPKLAILSRELGPPGFISVVEVEKGTCVCGGGNTPPPPPRRELTAKLICINPPGRTRTLRIRQGRNGVFTALFPNVRPGRCTLRIEDPTGELEPVQATLNKRQRCTVRARVRIRNGRIVSVQ